MPPLPKTDFHIHATGYTGLGFEADDLWRPATRATP